MNNIAQTYTHQVAVNAYLLFNDKFLLLKRNTPPRIWGPPGGRLKLNENPESGLKREVAEETGLKIFILGPVTTWFGRFRDHKLLSIDYLCKHEGGTVKISKEHTEFKWIDIIELKEKQTGFLTEGLGFQYSDFELAWHIYLMKENRISELKTQN